MHLITISLLIQIQEPKGKKIGNVFAYSLSSFCLRAIKKTSIFAEANSRRALIMFRLTRDLFHVSI